MIKKLHYTLILLLLSTLYASAQPFVFYKKDVGHLQVGMYDNNRHFINYTDKNTGVDYIQILDNYGDSVGIINRRIDTAIVYKRLETTMGGSTYVDEPNNYTKILNGGIMLRSGDVILGINQCVTCRPIFMHTDPTGKKIGPYFVLPDSNYVYDKKSIAYPDGAVPYRLYSNNSDSFYLVTGKRRTYKDTTGPINHLYDSAIATVYKMNKDFTIIWKKDFVSLENFNVDSGASYEFEQLELFTPTLDGGFIIASHHDSGQLGLTNTIQYARWRMGYVDKYDANGEHQWQKNQRELGDTSYYENIVSMNFCQFPDSGFVFLQRRYDTFSHYIHYVTIELSKKCLVSTDKNGNLKGCISDDWEPRFAQFVPLGNKYILSQHYSNRYVFLLFDRQFNVVKPIVSPFPYNTYRKEIYSNDIGGGYVKFYQADTSGTTIDVCIINFDSNLVYNVAKIGGRVANDVDKNCAINYNDKFRNSVVKVTNVADSVSYYGFTNSLGYYNIPIPNGVYTIEHPTHNHVATACGKYPVTNVIHQNNYTGMYFCDTAIPGLKDLRVYVLNSISMPYDVTEMHIAVRNYGYSSVKDVLKFVIDPAFTYVDMSIPTVKIDGDTSYFDLNIPPDSGFFFTVTLAPKNMPHSGIDSVTFRAYVPYANTDTMHADSVVYKTQQMSVLRSNYLFTNQPLYIPAHQEIAVTNCFSNVDLDFAHGAVIEHILDKKLDITSLELLSHTHLQPDIYVTPGGNLRFSFEQINLNNSGKSQACFSYKIKPKPTVKNGDSIMIESIKYMDYFKPIYSDNITLNIVQKEEVKDTLVQTPQLQVYPNPTTGDLTLVLPKNCQEGTVSVYDMLGRQVYEQYATNKKIELQLDAAAGIYVIRFVDKAVSTTYTEKLMVQH